MWTEEFIEDMRSSCSERQLEGTYGTEETNLLVESLRRTRVKDASVLVIGSEKPWIEACALSLGAKDVMTIEYGGIQSTHP